MKKLILGIGNTLKGDEGLGVFALEYLNNEPWLQEQAELQDGGTLGLTLLPVVESCTHLLILDSVDTGKKAGTLIELSGNEIPMFRNVKMSVHQTGFQEVLGLAAIRGKLPQNLFLLGIQPEDTSTGIGLSNTVKEAMPGLVVLAKRIVETWQHVY